MGKKIRKDETKAANAAKVVTEQDYNALLEKYQEATKRIDLMSKDSDELVKEIASLKSSIGSYKSANTKTRNELEKMKAYAKEADELNEQKAEQIASLNATVEEKDRVIAGLQSQIAELNKRIANNEKNIQDLTGERDVAIANYDYVCGLPWYQRMFFKGK